MCSWKASCREHGGRDCWGLLSRQIIVDIACYPRESGYSAVFFHFPLSHGLLPWKQVSESSVSHPSPLNLHHLWNEGFLSIFRTTISCFLNLFFLFLFHSASPPCHSTSRSHPPTSYTVSPVIIGFIINPPPSSLILHHPISQMEWLVEERTNSVQSPRCDWRWEPAGFRGRRESGARIDPNKEVI